MEVVCIIGNGGKHEITKTLVEHIARITENSEYVEDITEVESASDKVYVTPVSLEDYELLYRKYNGQNIKGIVITEDERPECLFYDFLGDEGNKYPLPNESLLEAFIPRLDNCRIDDNRRIDNRELVSNIMRKSICYRRFLYYGIRSPPLEVKIT